MILLSQQLPLTITCSIYQRQILSDRLLSVEFQFEPYPQHLKDAFCYLQACIVYNKKSVIILFFVSLYIMCLFFFYCFKNCLLIIGFHNLIMDFGIVFFVFFLFQSHSVLEIVHFQFLSIQKKLLAVTPSIIFPVPLQLFCIIVSPIMHKLKHLILSLR